MAQTHVHEVQGSVELGALGFNPHNHRFATMSDQVIPENGDHMHCVFFRTDFYEGHFHEFRGLTNGEVDVGDRHVHFLAGVTTTDAGHNHEFRVATLIEDPIGD